jgi:hypothetical protein
MHVLTTSDALQRRRSESESYRRSSRRWCPPRRAVGLPTLPGATSSAASRRWADGPPRLRNSRYGRFVPSHAFIMHARTSPLALLLLPPAGSARLAAALLEGRQHQFCIRTGVAARRVAAGPTPTYALLVSFLCVRVLCACVASCVRCVSVWHRTYILVTHAHTRRRNERPDGEGVQGGDRAQGH